MATTMTTTKLELQIAYAESRLGFDDLHHFYALHVRTKYECFCVRVVVIVFLSSLIATIRFHPLFDLPRLKLLCINFVSFGLSFSSPLRSSFHPSLFLHIQSISLLAIFFRVPTLTPYLFSACLFLSSCLSLSLAQFLCISLDYCVSSLIAFPCPLLLSTLSFPLCHSFLRFCVIENSPHV